VSLLLLFAAAGLYMWAVHTYHARRLAAISSSIGLSPEEKVVKAAASLQGVLYDYSGGRLPSLGLLVCTDVPRLAYRAAGIDLDELMAADYRLHPKRYAFFPGNNPSTRYFARRVVNQKVFFSDTGRLIKDCAAPQPGDTVFYGDSHVSMVLAVYPDRTWDEIEAAPATVWVTIHRRKAWLPRDVGRFAHGEGA